MQVDRNVERFGRFEDVPVLLVVQKSAERVRVDDAAAHAELPDRALELLGGVRGIQRTERGEAHVARGVARYRFGKLVVEARGERGRCGRIENLHAGRG